MAPVDPEYQVIWASFGAPGKTHYSTLLQPTDLCRCIVEEEVISNLVQKVEDVEIPP